MSGNDDSTSSRYAVMDSKKRNPLPAMIEDFSPIWFAICMNTGILAIIMNRLPYQFKGLPVLTDVVFVFDLLLFVIFSFIMLLRLFTYPQQALKRTKESPAELAFFANWAIAFLTLTGLVSLVASNAYWGGYAFTLVAYIMWWIGAAWILATAFIVYITLFTTQATYDRDLNIAIVIPPVGVATLATVGGLICNYSAGINERLAVPIIIFSYMMLGLAVFVSICVYAIYFHRLFAVGFPPAELIPGLCIAVGPPGQCSTALQLLGTAATHHFGAYDKGTFLQASSAQALDAASILLALLFFGFGIWWTLLAVYKMLEAAFRKQLKYTMVWWSTIFPIATMCTSLITFAVELDSPAFRVLGTGLFLILLIDYFINWAFTIRGIISRDILVPVDARKQS